MYRATRVNQSWQVKHLEWTPDDQGPQGFEKVKIYKGGGEREREMDHSFEYL